ncbi:hypothetical protein PUN28_010418 [Cardiocondyla obscurior]|uniref:F-box/LRR-repeat protein 21 n=1 Tax=Cardiocondyla obscurior TaxID=286306 RepID=A0AAW2FP92_9HYME
MFAVTSTAKLKIDDEHFKSVVTISKTKNVERKKNHYCDNDENDPRALHLMRVKGFPRLLPEGILALTNYCRWLRELSLSYALLSDELLFALCSIKHIHLETLRIEANPETKPVPCISDKAWAAFSNRLPDINFALLSYMTNEDDQKLLFTSHIPVTHLYLGDATSELIMSQISNQCPRLIELVIAAYGSSPIDQFLISVAKTCSQLSAVGLGNCEITCSGLAKFVALCAHRLQVLCVSETSLIEDEDFDIAKVSTNLSSLLGRTWVPEYVPLW